MVELSPPFGARITGIPGGSIIVFSAPEHSEDLNAINAAVEKHDYRLLGRLMTQILGGWASPKRFTRAQPIPLKDITTLAELHYGNRLVAGGLFSIPELGTMASLIPFVGGVLDPDDFKVLSFLTDWGKPLEHLVLIRQPDLTLIEREINDRLPSELSQERLGSAEYFVYPGVVAGLVVIAALVVVGHFLLNGLTRANEQNRQVQAGAGDAGDGDDGDGDGDGGVLSGFTEDLVSLSDVDPSAAVATLLTIRTKLIGSKLNI